MLEECSLLNNDAPCFLGLTLLISHRSCVQVKNQEKALYTFFFFKLNAKFEGCFFFGSISSWSIHLNVTQ